MLIDYSLQKNSLRCRAGLEPGRKDTRLKTTARAPIPPELLLIVEGVYYPQHLAANDNEINIDSALLSSKEIRE
jgi:hypothetical protein